jgi:hypothetical protein
MGAPGMRLPQRALRRLPYRAICCIDTVDTLPWSFQALPTQPKEGKANLGRGVVPRDFLWSREPGPGATAGNISCNGGGEATAGELQVFAMRPIADRRPIADAGQPQTNIRTCGSNPRIRA